MALVKVEGKTLTIPDEIVAAGTDAIRAALSVDFPAVENAQIEVVQPEKAGAPSVVTVSKRATPKGGAAAAPALTPEQQRIVDALLAAPEYQNPAISLAADVVRAELAGDREFFESLARRGEVERAINECNREGQAVADALFKAGHTKPAPSLTVPVGF